MPLFAILGSAIFYNEQIGMTKLLACVCILSGVGFGFIEGLAGPLIKKLKLKVSFYRVN